MSPPLDEQPPPERAAIGASEGPLNRERVDRLVVEHLPLALRFAQRLVGDANVAEELVQEALCRVLRHWKKYRGDSAFSTWLLQILVNTDRDRRRRQRPMDEFPTEQLATPSPGPQQELSADELRERIRAEIDRLPDRQREVVLLAVGEKLAAPAIAEVLQIPVGSVHTNLHLARKKIAAAIGFERQKLK